METLIEHIEEKEKRYESSKFYHSEWNIQISVHGQIQQHADHRGVLPLLLEGCSIQVGSIANLGSWGFVWVANRHFTSKHTHPVDVWVKQGCTCCNAQMGDVNQNNNRTILWQETQKTQSNKV